MQSQQYPQSISSKSNYRGGNISIKDFLNIKLGQGAVVTVQTPRGTKATIHPIKQPSESAFFISDDEAEEKE